MLICDKRVNRKFKKLKEIDTGNLFELKSVSESGIFIKTKSKKHEEDIGDNILCVNVGTGETTYFNCKEDVIAIKSKVILEN